MKNYKFSRNKAQEAHGAKKDKTSAISSANLLEELYERESLMQWQYLIYAWKGHEFEESN